MRGIRFCDYCSGTGAVLVVASFYFLFGPARADQHHLPRTFP